MLEICKEIWLFFTYLFLFAKKIQLFNLWMPNLSLSYIASMKKIVIIFAFLSIVGNISFAQTPGCQWAERAGGTGHDGAFSVAVDASENSYVAGFFYSSSITFGSDTLTNAGLDDIFLAKFDANGNAVWARSAGGTGYDNVYSVVVDALGNVYITGCYGSPTIAFGFDTLSNVGLLDIFIVKYDADGNVVWAKNTGGSSNDVANSITIDLAGNLVVTGMFNSPAIIFGSDTLTNAGNDDVFLAKYDSSGNLLWAKRAGGTDSDQAYSIVMDVAGNVLLTGYFASPTITFGSDTLTSAGWVDIFLAKYNNIGDVVWGTSAGGTDFDGAVSLAVDTSGNAYFTGYFYSPIVVFGSDTLTNVSPPDLFIVKYDTNGDVVWAHSSGGTKSDIGMSVAVDAAGNACLTGTFESPEITFGSCTLTNFGSFDVLFVGYDSFGNVLWAESAGGTDYDAGRCILIDGYLTGWFESPTITFGPTTLSNAGTNSADIFLVKLSNITGSKLLKDPLNIHIYPNPASELITIDTPDPGQLFILNLNGQALIVRQVTEAKTIVDISALPSGINVMKVVGEKGVRVGKFIKQ